MRIERTTTRLSGEHSTTELYALWFGMAGLEPTHVCIKNKRLTAWLHSIISVYIAKYNRDGVIRTRDLLNPNQIRYQATLHPVFII